MATIQRALISVSDKAGLIPFVQILAQAGIEIISTGGTAKALRDAGLAVKDISEHTGFPEMLDGRVKTLHPKVHGGLLYIRGNATHEAAVKAHDISPIDLVVVNLYPFEATVAKPNVSLHDAIENIDIGGPSMLRSAAKNHDSVTVIVDPADYAEVAKQISESGNTTLELRRMLCAKVYARTAAYDGAIAAHLQKEFKVAQAATLPALLSISAPLVQALRYGENPHQAAALYGKFNEFFQQLHGKELSYNNILDLTAAANLLAEFEKDPPTLRTSQGSAASGDFKIFNSRRFFFCCKITSASGEKSGATITSLKISAIASAQAASSVRFTAMMPPNGACLSVANALSQASRNVFPCPTPQGFVCLRIASVGESFSNSVIRAAAAVRSRMLL